MNELTRARIWSILNDGFEAIHETTLSSDLDVKVKSGHQRNPAFLFWAYAEFSLAGRTIVISFNIKRREAKIEVWGDIAREDGFVVKDIIRTEIEETVDYENRLVDLALKFVADCEKETELIVQELRPNGLVSSDS